jgi:hypothetical protein
MVVGIFNDDYEDSPALELYSQDLDQYQYPIITTLGTSSVQTLRVQVFDFMGLAFMSLIFDRCSAFPSCQPWRLGLVGCHWISACEFPQIAKSPGFMGSPDIPDVTRKEAREKGDNFQLCRAFALPLRQFCEGDIRPHPVVNKPSCGVYDGESEGGET